MARDRKYTTDKPGYEAVKAYREKKNIVRVPLDMPEDEAAALRRYCDDSGVKVATFIRDLVKGAIAAAADPGQVYPVGDISLVSAGRVTPVNTPEK